MRLPVFKPVLYGEEFNESGFFIIKFSYGERSSKFGQIV